MEISLRSFSLLKRESQSLLRECAFVCLSHRTMLGTQLVYPVYIRPQGRAQYFELDTNDFPGYKYSVTVPSRKPNCRNLGTRVSNFTHPREQCTSTKKCKQTPRMRSKDCDSSLRFPMYDVDQ